VAQEVVRILNEVKRHGPEIEGTRGLEPMIFGPLHVWRDWGYAPEFAEAAWLMLQSKVPADYVLGTGETHTTMEFVETAFSYTGLPMSTLSTCLRIKEDAVPKLPQSEYMQADTSKINCEIGWKARHKFHEVIRMMVEHEMKKRNVS